MHKTELDLLSVSVSLNRYILILLFHEEPVLKIQMQRPE